MLQGTQVLVAAIRLMVAYEIRIEHMVSIYYILGMSVFEKEHINV